MAIRSRCLLLAIVCLSPHAAEAQVTPVVNPFFVGPTVRGPFSAGYDPVSGQMFGAAEIIRSVGQSNQALGLGLEAQSRALINYEQARAKYIENAERWTDVYNRRRRQALALEAYEREQARAELQQYLRNRPDPAPPQTLTPAQLNPSSGDIAWPSALLDEDYAELRQAIEQEFATLARTSGAAGNVRKIQDLADMMRDVLRANIREMPAYEYIAARKFIDGLANSAATL